MAIGAKGNACAKFDSKGELHLTTQAQLEKRMTDERAVISKLIQTAQAAGFALTKVNDSEEIIRVSTEAQAMDAVFSVDESQLYFKHPGHTKGHSVWIVLGNSGPECIADCSEGDGWDTVMQEVSAYCDAIEASAN